MVSFTPEVHIALDFLLGSQINLTDASRAVWGVLQIETPRRKIDNLIMYKWCPWQRKGITWCSIHVLSFIIYMNSNKTVSLSMHHTYMCNSYVLIKPATWYWDLVSLFLILLFSRKESLYIVVGCNAANEVTSRVIACTANLASRELIKYLNWVSDVMCPM